MSAFTIFWKLTHHLVSPWQHYILHIFWVRMTGRGVARAIYPAKVRPTSVVMWRNRDLWYIWIVRLAILRIALVFAFCLFEVFVTLAVQNTEHKFFFDRRFHFPVGQWLNQLVLGFFELVDLLEVIIKWGLVSVSLRATELQQILPLKSEELSALLAEKQVLELVHLVKSSDHLADI